MDHFRYLCFMFVSYTVLSVPCSLVVTCWEQADLLALLYVVFSCVFVTFPCGVLGQVRYLIVSIPDLILTQKVSMIRKYHNHTLQIYPRHREEEPQKS